jgi:F-type H+-transporting ATPase subunit delta
MLELVRGYAMAAFDASVREDRTEAVAAGLDEMSHLFVSSETLRNAITDPSIPAQARGAVLEDLLADKVPEEALAVVTFAVEYERAGEVPKTTEHLVGLAETVLENVAAGEPQPAEPPIGRGGAYERIRGYAERVFETIPAREDIDVIEQELFQLARLAEVTPQLRDALGDGSVPLGRRLAVMTDLLEGKVRLDTLMLCAYVLRAGRASDLVGALESLVELAAAERGRRLADVRSAVELDDDERQRLEAALARIARRPVELRVQIDPGVIGGLSIVVGNTIIDGTLRHRLEQLRESLLQPLLQPA